jgi:RNA polymerase sigma factor (sigma-70 family)
MFQSDEELVLACRQGVETAWETIVFKYQKLLFSIPRRAGLSHDLSGDVLQDVFKTLFEKIDFLEKPEFLRAWLITTAKYKTIHLIQRERRGKPVSIDDSDFNFSLEIADNTLLPDDVLIQFERDSQIKNAFEAIDERCQRLLSMLYMEKTTLSYAEIAEATEIPIGSIGPTRARCLEKLIKNLPKL